MEGRESEIEAYLKLRVPRGVDRVSIGDQDGARGVVYLMGGSVNQQVRELLAVYPQERLTALPSQHRSLVPFEAGLPGPPTGDRVPATIREHSRLIAKELQLAGITEYEIHPSLFEDGHGWEVLLGTDVSHREAVGAIARAPQVRDVRANPSRRSIVFVVDLAHDRTTESCGRLP